MEIEGLQKRVSLSSLGLDEAKLCLSLRGIHGNRDILEAPGPEEMNRRSLFALEHVHFYVTQRNIVQKDVPHSIAYDNVRSSARPEKWNMQTVLGVATVLGIFGVVASFGLYYIGYEIFHLSLDTLQTLLYLKLSVAGHLTVFVARTRGPFWSVKPAKVLVLAVIGTQIVATLIAVYGVFMTPLGWKWAGFVWGYSLAWFILNDQVKLAAYRIFGKEHAGVIYKNSNL